MKSISKYTILIILLVIPAIIYNYMTKGYNNFIKLDVIGAEGHVIPDFSFVNQNSEVVTNDNVYGNIYVANFFFTSCPTICPVMTKNMAYVQRNLDVYPNISINLDNWDFVTGDKNEIYEIAKSYFVSASKDSLAVGGFLHSEYFVLIDKEGRVRSGIDKNNNVVGVYDGTNEAQMKDLVNDVKVLMAEYKRPTK